MFQTAFADRAVRRPERPGAQLHIYGPLESRLMQADRVIVGGLIEGVWPPAPRIDPWLSRPMRHELGLDLPERRIGLSAHDFAQLLGTEDVILSHSAKAGGAPAVASRFLHRLEAVAGDERWKAAKQAGETYVHFAHALDQPERVQPIAQPEPRPPRATRPLKLSVTAIEDWLRDPYTIYAKYILKLEALDPVDMPLSAADRGSAIHDALGEFTKAYAAKLPDDPALRVEADRREVFRAVDGAPRGARAMVAALPAHRGAGLPIGKSPGAAISRQSRPKSAARSRFSLDHERTFILSARADRIERRNDGSFAILDYKTGQPPTGKQVRMGLSPQLTLEAAILREGGFEGIAAGASVGELVYVRLSGNNPPGEQRLLELKIKPGDYAAAARCRGRLRTKTARGADPQIRGRGRALSLAQFADVDQSLRRLRRSGPYQGMVGGRRPGDRGMVKSPRPIPEAVRAAQARASDPAASAFVSANAGSGKTHVLVQRVIRLLLDGVPPEKILCITFTKAAAANMAERVFSTLGHWVTLDDAALDTAIREVGIAQSNVRLREAARRLFASALETPGGLKVQTIHALCTRLLAAVSVRGQRARAICRAR